jgi:nucleotide-binding universal stress UspA family protein
MMEGTIRNIVVGVAEMMPGDPAAAAPGEDPVLEPAAMLADRLGATLHVVHALDRAPSGCGPGRPGVLDSAALQRRRLAAEKRLAAQVARFPNRARISPRCVSGPAAVQLCAFAEEAAADLMIVGVTRRNGMWHNLLGSTAEAVVLRSSVPVLVLRHAFPRPVRRVLLTTDLAETGAALHEAGLDAVEALFGGGVLTVRTLLACAYDSAAAARVSQRFLRDAATVRLHGFLDQRRPRSYPVSERVRLGNPSTEILREVDEWKADLLVLAPSTRRVGSPRRLGSTAAALLRGSSCNALVVPAAGLDLREGDRSGLGHREAPGFPGTEEQPASRLLVVPA